MSSLTSLRQKRVSAYASASGHRQPKLMYFSSNVPRRQIARAIHLEQNISLVEWRHIGDALVSCEFLRQVSGDSRIACTLRNDE
jgi:hypothetical protein